MAATSYWYRMLTSRISRRRLLAAGGAGAAGLVAAGALRSDRSLAIPAEAPTAVGPVRGGRYKFATTGDFGTIDPVTSVAFGPTIFPRMYNTLVDRSRRQADFFYFDLAEAFEQPDQETYVFTIRPGVRIAPNDLSILERQMDAFDAARWLERIISDANAVHRSFTDQWLQSFDVPNAQRLQIRTNGPYAYFLSRLGTPLGGTIPPREFFEQGISLNAQGVGAGPFVLQPGTFSESGEALLVRNPNYYRTDASTGLQLPYVDEIEALRIDDRRSRRTAFVDGQIHAYGAQTIDEVDTLRPVVPDLQVFEEPFNTYISFTMNPTRSPWDDERLRKAAMLALNRQQFVDLIVGGAGQPNGLVHWPLGDFALPPEELDQLQPFDPEQSRQLITDAGHQIPFHISVIYPLSDIEFHNQHLPIWRQQMEDAGFALDEEVLDFGTWLDRYTRVDYESSLSLNQIYETPEIPLDWHASQGPQGDGNFAIGIGSLFPEVDQAILDSKRTTNLAEQVEAVRDAQRLIYERGPAFLPIMSWIEHTLRQGSVMNWPRGLGSTESYLNDWWLGNGPKATPPPTDTPPATHVGAGAATPTAAISPLALPSAGAAEQDSDGGMAFSSLTGGAALAGGAIALGAAALRLRTRCH